MTQTEAYLLTLAIEVPIAVEWAAWKGWARGRRWLVALAGIAASTLTHPILWIVDPMLWDALETPLRWGILEAAIAGVEGAVYTIALGWSVGRGLCLSLLANGVSFGVGIAIYALR